MSAQEPLRVPAEKLKSIPPLATKPLKTPEDRLTALHLITDSIAQQRQSASQSLILSPLFIALWSAMIGILLKTQYTSLSDIGLIATTGAGLTMVLLLIVRSATEGYIRHAETVSAMKLAFFEEDGSDEVVILGTKYGDELIGTCVVKLPNPEARFSSAVFDSIPKVTIKAWTVELRFRHKGIGLGLLEEAVKIARKRFGKDVLVEFEKEHANSKMVLPGLLNGLFERKERKGREMLRDVVVEARADDVEDMI